MLRSYFLVALRSFWRNKTFSFINILGLSIGISASLIIFLLVRHDFSFDKFEKDGARIYRVVNDGVNQNGIWHNNCLSEPMGGVVRDQVTGLEVVAPFRTLYETRVTVPYPDPNNPVVIRKQKDLIAADKNYFDLVGYTWLAGSPATATQEPYEVVLTEKNARLYYAGLPNSEIIGKSIFFDDSIHCTVTGIVKDLPGNSDFYFGTMISRSTYYTSRLKPGGFGVWGWTENADQLFVKLAPGTRPAAVNAQMTKGLLTYEKPDPHNHSSSQAANLQPLSDIHFNGDYGVFDNARGGNKPALYGLLAVGGFLLLLACINFINLTTAQASQRAKEIGIRKTMGSDRGQLTAQFLTETFVLTSVAAVLSVVLTPVLLRMFADFIPADFHFNLFRQPGVIGFLFVLVVCVSLLAGMYPALILSRFKPVLVLKNQAFSGAGRTRSAWLRKSLTVSQFVIAQVFIIATLLVSKQIRYAINRDLGFKKDAIVYFRTNGHQDPRKKLVLLEKLRAMPGVGLVSLSNNPPSTNGTYTATMVVNDGKKDIQQNVQAKFADTNYIRLYGLHLLAGTGAAESDTTNAVAINETYLHLLGYQDPRKVIGMQIRGWGSGPRTIVGVVTDFFPNSVRKAIQPLVVANGTNEASVFNVGLQPRNENGSNWPTVLGAIAKAFHEVYPNDDYDFQFVDDTIAQFYTEERSVAKLLTWATGLTLFVSCLGLLGLVIYITNQRTKEIGIRKVIGASVMQIVVLLSHDFVRPIGLAIVIAMPISWWATHKWLTNFAYRTDLSWWVFASGGALLLVLALVVLCLRAFRAARANPVESLRTE